MKSWRLLPMQAECPACGTRVDVGDAPIVTLWKEQPACACDARDAPEPVA